VLPVAFFISSARWPRTLGILENYRCPRCQGKTITFWQKQSANAAFPITCPNCGAKLTEPFVRTVITLFAAAFPPFFGTFLMYLVIPLLVPGLRYSEIGVYGSLGLGFVLACVAAMWAFHRFVPLISRDA